MSIETCNGARKPVIDADGGSSLRRHLPRLPSTLTVIAGSHLYRSRRSGGCLQRAMSELALRDRAPARSSGLREGAAGTTSRKRAD